MKKFIAFCLALFTALSVTLTAYAGSDITLDIKKDNISHPASQMLYGVNFANESFRADGGICSELVCNNSFEYSENREINWIFSDLAASTQSSDSMNINNPYYAKITVDGQGYAKNLGYTRQYKDNSKYDEALASNADMGFKKGESYNFSCFLKNVDFEGTISVYLDSKFNSSNVVQLSINNLSNTVWKKFSTRLKSVATENGGLVIVFKGKGTLYMDYVSLCPQSSYGYGREQWKYSTLRSDAVTAVSSLKPAFIRFGNVGENGIYSWKSTIGPLEERKQTDGAHTDKRICSLDTAAIGYHEYFQLCEELSAKAIPVVSAGMSAQGEKYELMAEAYDKLYMTDEQYYTYLANEKGFSLNDKSALEERAKYINSLGIKSADDWERYINSVALEPDTDEFSNYAQDVLDLIEYANGDAVASYWGSLRSANGHQEPFNMKYIALGNENWGEVYFRNLKALQKIINKKYPDIKVIASSGSNFNGEILDRTWSNVNSEGVDVILDEHYSTEEGMLLENSNKYDSYDRAGAEVIVGGFNALSSKQNSLFSAIEEAVFSTGLERNSDIVGMSAYSKTLSKSGLSRNENSLIWFNSNDLVLTPSYYCRLIFANNYGKEYVNASFNGLDGENLYQSVTADTDSQTVYVKLVNAGSSKQKITVSLSGFDDVNYVSELSISGDKSSVNSADKQAVMPAMQSIECEGNSFEYACEPYSAGVIRIAYGDNTGKAFYMLPEGMRAEKKNTKKDIFILLAVVVAVFLISSVAGYLFYTRYVLKKQGKGYKLFGKKQDKDE